VNAATFGQRCWVCAAVGLIERSFPLSPSNQTMRCWASGPLRPNGLHRQFRWLFFDSRPPGRRGLHAILPNVSKKKTRDDFFRKQVLHAILPTPVVRRSRYPALQTGTRRTSSGQEKRQGVHHACQAQSMKRDRASTYALARPYNSQTMPSV
jgi:hypothetical protein